jgi:hypothetical protein
MACSILFFVLLTNIILKRILMSKVYYVDSFNIKGAHEQFNSSLILMCRKLFVEVKCFTSKSSYQNHVKLTKNRDVLTMEYRNLYVVAGDKKISWLIRYIISAVQNIRFLFIVPKDAILIFPFNNLFSLSILNFFNRFLRKKVVIFCHGEMEGLLGANMKSGTLAKMLYRLLNNFLLNPNVKIADDLYFVVLGDKIKENITKLIAKDKSSNFISIDHPYLFDFPKEKIIEAKKLNFGIVGVLNESKGANIFLEFVDLLSSSVRDKIIISAIGKIDIATEKLVNRDIFFLPQNGTIISRKIFDLQINELDFILFFYHHDSYKITASGAIMDALNMQKPILALRNDYFDYLFEKFGHFGYLFDSINQMTDVLEKIVSGEMNTKFNFMQIKNNFSPESIAIQMENEFEKIRFINRLK